MKNIIFISPNFPVNFWLFCQELKADGMNVLGIGDQPYDELTENQKNSLTEYFKVNSLENYEEVYRAVAFFIYRYGKIDWLESNNEYWLEQDAKLRTAFHITSGFQEGEMDCFKLKSRMKEIYQKIGIPAARWHLVDDLEGCLAFLDEVGYPVVVKPDNGVGASHTYKLSSEDELREFMEVRFPDISYIMEEFVRAEINSYDAIIDSHGTPVFETGNVTPVSIMDMVNLGVTCQYYIVPQLPDDVLAAGRAAVTAFGVKSRFVHFEFFRLTEDQGGLGKKGDLVGLEVNMRPSGGFSTDMFNFAHSTNVYKIWADVIAYDQTLVPQENHAYCAFVGRRDFISYKVSHEQILSRYQRNLHMSERMPDALSDAMGNQTYIATFQTRPELDQFFSDVLAME